MSVVTGTCPSSFRHSARPAPGRPLSERPPTAGQASTAADADRDHRVRHLFQVRAAEGDAPGGRRAREEVILLHTRLASHLARRFRNRGEQSEDLTQVAMLALVKAVDGFDVDRGSAFVGYAVPTILGELRRHLRDKAWHVRIPRRLQEIRAELGPSTERLGRELGRPPTVAELARALGVDEADIREARLAASAYSAVSLHRRSGAREADGLLLDRLGNEDAGYAGVETHHVLRQVLPTLPERERHIVGLRFYHQLTQTEIAAEIGISQMHVSRLLSRSLLKLRSLLDAEGAAATG